VALGRVIVPLDGTDPATRARYRQYAASRHERTLKPQGDRRILFAPDLFAPDLFAPDLVGTAAEIVERLRSDGAVAEVSELRLELPYEFDERDHEQILHDVRTPTAPKLGWQPLNAVGTAACQVGQPPYQQQSGRSAH
jgi:hypothetical protein